VTCHHVLYNVAELGPFVTALTSHARRLVVVELTARHPLTALNPLWERFHGLVRPNVPTACDALACWRSWDSHRVTRSGLARASQITEASRTWSR